MAPGTTDKDLKESVLRRVVVPLWFDEICSRQVIAARFGR
jgi:hypothetical protein